MTNKPGLYTVVLKCPQYSLSPDPRSWGSDLSPDLVENDDALHNPDTEPQRPEDPKQLLLNKRSLINLGCLLTLFFMILFLLYVPLSVPYALPHVGARQHRISGHHVFHPRKSSSIRVQPWGNKLLRTGDRCKYLPIPLLTSRQIPSMGNFGLIDLDTPQDAYHKDSHRDGSPMVLVFSDEFNRDGRSFYPGDDPYWEASDLHYWASIRISRRSEPMPTYRYVYELLLLLAWLLINA